MNAVMPVSRRQNHVWRGQGARRLGIRETRDLHHAKVDNKGLHKLSDLDWCIAAAIDRQAKRIWWMEARKRAQNERRSRGWWGISISYEWDIELERGNGIQVF